jgi:hypothetical protein
LHNYDLHDHFHKCYNNHQDHHNFKFHDDNIVVDHGALLPRHLPYHARWRLRSLVLQGVRALCVHHNSDNNSRALLPRRLLEIGRWWLREVVVPRLHLLHNNHDVDKYEHNRRIVPPRHLRDHARWRLWLLVLRWLLALRIDYACTAVPPKRLLNAPRRRLRQVVVQKLHAMYINDNYNDLP